MSTLQPAHSHGLSPLLLSPAAAPNQFVIFDNSDQGSVDSDYTSLGSSKFYGNGGSTSSLHRQGRSQSIDELAATTTIPTRHFNGTLNVNKLNNDPLQFVKIHPNHELIERAQEQLTLLESRKRLQETFKLSNHHLPTISTSNVNIAHAASTKSIDDETDWSKAVENWRQKREEKRKQSLKATRSDDDAPVSPPYVERSLSSPAHKSIEPETKRNPSPPPTVASPVPPVVKPSTEQLEAPSRPPVKSPSPQRIRGPARVHDVYIQKAVDVRGFGFKLDGGPAHNRAIYISTLEEGSPADRAGLCVDDEIVSMNDENIEHMTFDQVRKILKERNLRGSIKLVVKTYEDVVDENSQTITTEHSRTPSPQKPVSHSQPITSTSPAPAPARTTPVPSTPPATVQAPIYTFLPYTPPPSSLPTPDAPANTPSQQTSISSLNVFGPKPFRLNASVPLDTHKTTETSTSRADEQQQQLPPPVVPKPPPPESVNTPPANPTLFTSELKHSLTSPTQPKTLPPPLTSVETLLQGTPLMSNQAPPRSFGEHPVPYPRSPPSRDPRSVNIPIDMSTPNSNRAYSGRSDANETALHYFDLSHQPGFSPSYPKRSMQDIPSMFINPPATNLSRLSSAHSSDRALNEIKPNQSVPTCNPPPKKSSTQLDEKKPAPQRVTNKQLHSTFTQLPKKAAHEEYSWNSHEQGKPTVPPPPPASALLQRNGKPLSAHRPPPPIPLDQESHIHVPTSKHVSMFHYGESPDDLHYRPLRNAQHHRDSDPTGQRHLQFKSRPRSPVRTTISSNNNRVLSVSGKLHCSRCNEELGQGSAMVIESLGLYYHIECFRCFVCHAPLSSSFEGTDVRVRSNRLHCQNCFSDENGVRSSAV